MIELRSFVAIMHSGKDQGPLHVALQIVLWPFSIAFRIGVVMRNLCHSIGVLRTHHLDCPVISVGNLTTGGTGKTPVTILLAARLQKQLVTAILSRGYGSGNENSSVTLRGDQITSMNSASFGDELNLMAARLPEVWFGIGADRTATGSELVAREHVQVALLDDGFQHRRIARQCDIVLIDASNPFGNGFFLPAGPRREGVGALRRSHIVLLTRCESVAPEEVDDLARQVGRCVADDQVFRIQTVITSIHDLAGTPDFAIVDRRVWLFSGIGNPSAFENSIAASGARICGHTAFPDHHPYSPRDIESLARILTTGRADCLLTTAKDATKLRSSGLDPHRCGVVEIGIDFVDRADIFWGIIARSVGAEI